MRATTERTALAPPGLLARLFPHRPRERGGRDRSAPRARAAPSRELPKEVVWHILTFWRSQRDDEADALLEPTAADEREICSSVLRSCVMRVEIRNEIMMAAYDAIGPLGDYLYESGHSSDDDAASSHSSDYYSESSHSSDYYSDFGEDFDY